MVELHEQGALMACGSPTGTDTPVNQMGVPQGHAFAILMAKEVSDGKGNKARLIKIRNSLGDGGWTGRFSSQDKSRWTPRLTQLMQYTPDQDASSGVFCMSFGDFVQQYDHLYVCRLFKQPKWHSATAAAAWIRNKSAGGSPSFDSVVDNPQFFVEVSAPCDVFISLRVVQVAAADASASSSSSTGSSPSGISIGLKLYQKGGNRLRQCFQSEERAATRVFSEAREISISSKLQPEPTPLTLLPCTFYPNSEAMFVVTVASTAPLKNLGPGGTLKLIPKSVGASWQQFNWNVLD